MTFFADIIARLNRQRKSFLITLGIISVVLIGVMHYIESAITKGQLSFSIFYLLPIFLVSWHVNLRAGIIFSFICAIVWEAIDFMTGPAYSHPLIPYWNTAVRLGFFLIVSIMLSRIKIITAKISMNVEQLRQEIAERRQVQQAFNEQRDKFLSVLIHDLKGPLIPVMCFTKRLIDGKARSEEDIMINLKTIQASSQELLKTIEVTSKDLKEKLALESFNPGEVDLRDMLLSVVMRFMPEMENKGIEIIINNKSREGWNDLEKVVFKADSYQLKTLVENLIGNAIKYAEKTMKVELNKNDSYVRFVISDDGPGIPEKYHEKIFEEYYQVPGSKKGTGIGLYSVNKTVVNHKGKIIIHSSSSKRASFVIVFPC